MENNLIFGIIFLVFVSSFLVLHRLTVRKLKAKIQLSKQTTVKETRGIVLKTIVNLQEKERLFNQMRTDLSLLKKDVRSIETESIPRIKKYYENKIEEFKKEYFENQSIELLKQELRFLKKENTWLKNQNKPYPTRQ